MRNILLMSTLVAGLTVSLYGMADDSQSACLEANADKPNKTGICDMQSVQAAIDARNKDLDDKYQKAKTDLKKESDDLAKKATQTPPSAPGTPSSPPSDSSGGGNTQDSSSGSTPPPGSPTPTNGTTTTGNADSTTSKSSDQTQPTKPDQEPKAGFGKKPATIQWY